MHGLIPYNQEFFKPGVSKKKKKILNTASVRGFSKIQFILKTVNNKNNEKTVRNGTRQYIIICTYYGFVVLTSQTITTDNEISLI